MKTTIRKKINSCESKVFEWKKLYHKSEEYWNKDKLFKESLKANVVQYGDNVGEAKFCIYNTYLKCLCKSNSLIKVNVLLKNNLEVEALYDPGRT